MVAHHQVKVSLLRQERAQLQRIALADGSPLANLIRRTVRGFLRHVPTAATASGQRQPTLEQRQRDAVCRFGCSVHVEFSEEDWYRLAALASDGDVSTSAVVRRILRAYLDRRQQAELSTERTKIPPLMVPGRQ